MKKLWILALLFVAACQSNEGDTAEVFTRDAQSDTATLLEQYWILADADEPLGRDIVEKDDGRDYMPGIVFISNGELVENPAGQMFRGEYSRSGDSIHVKYDDSKEGDYKIKRITKDSLYMDRTVENHTTSLLYYATGTWWPDVKTNPFARENMSWMVKPDSPETDEQIRKRAMDFVRFYQYYIEGYSRAGATRISFVGLPNIFNFYQSSITIPNNDTKLNRKWTDCFYNQADVEKAYAMIRHAVLMKYDWNTAEQNWINQMGPVLSAMRDSLAL